MNTTAKSNVMPLGSDRKELKTIQMSRIDKLELQNLMLQLALKKEKLDKLHITIADIQKEMHAIEAELNNWKDAYNKKLKKDGLSITNTIIDAESGIIREIVPKGK